MSLTQENTLKQQIKMKLKEVKYENYSAIVVEITNIYPLEGCDNLQGSRIMGNQVLISKKFKIGDKGVFFPRETQLLPKYLKENNLFRHAQFNLDPTQSGYFDDNGRVRMQKFKKFESQGLFMPIDTFEFTGANLDELNIGDKFDELNDIGICTKYMLKPERQPGLPGSKKPKDQKLKHLLVDDQFRFHQETSMLYSNAHKIKPDSLIHVSYKTHGSSGILSNVLIKKQLTVKEKLFNFLGANIPTTEYGFIYSSGKPKSNLPKGVVGKYKNDGLDFYSSDIWKQTYEMLKDYCTHGMSIYYEIVGFAEGGQPIQKEYDYGCLPRELKIMVYRVTYTNDKGVVFEMSAKQVQDWCKDKGLMPVHEFFYGYAIDLANKLNKKHKIVKKIDPENHFADNFLELIKLEYNEKDCFMCSNKVPEEGVVIRVEGNGFQAYKQKSEAFYKKESKALDKGETNMEDEA